MADKRLLIVEDDKAIADIIFRVALEEGFDVRIATGNLPLIAEYERFQPDAIILDILMPDIDGFEVLQFLSGRRSKAHIIISSGQPSYSKMAAKLGLSLGLYVADTILKPFRISDLRRAFTNLKISLSAPRMLVTEEMTKSLYK